MTQDNEYTNHWTADEGKLFTNSGTYAKEIWLGVGDTIWNWKEVDESEAEEINENINTESPNYIYSETDLTSGATELKTGDFYVVYS